MWVTDTWGWMHFMMDYNRVLGAAYGIYGTPTGTHVPARDAYIKREMTELLRKNPGHLRFLSWILPDHWPDIGAEPTFGR